MRNLVNITGSAATSGVSGLLAVQDRAWESVLFQQGKRPVDSELNLLQQVVGEATRILLKGLMGSGAASSWSPATNATANTIKLHQGPNLMPLIVDGRLVQVGDPDAANALIATLSAPPGGGTRDDLVFVEVWYEEVQPTAAPESVSSTVYKLGGVGNATIANDLIVIDGAESTRRIQCRWRLRVVDGIVKATYPNGMNAPTVLAQGGTGAPVAAKTFTQETLDSGLWTAGDGSQGAGAALKCVDGYVYAIPIAWIARAAGVTAIPTNAITMLARTIQVVNADTVDGYHANPTATANMLLPLDGSGKYPSSVIPSTIDADTVDTFHASATPTASKLLPLDGSGKFPNSVLPTGSGNGLDADKVDGFNASSTPTASTLLPLDGSGKFPNSVLPTGAGNGLDADKVDGFNASSTPTASTLLPLDGSGKFPNSVLPTGAGNGLDADKVDGFNASSTPTASTLLPLDGSGKFPNSVLPTGAGNGLDADLLDGQHAASFAAAVHLHSLVAPTSQAASATSCGTTYTTVATITLTPASPLSVFVSAWIYGSASGSGIAWTMAVFLDGVEQSAFAEPTVTGTGNANGGGVLSLTAGTRTITLRLKTVSSGTVTPNSGSLTVLQSAMS